MPSDWEQESTIRHMPGLMTVGAEGFQSPPDQAPGPPHSPPPEMAGRGPFYSTGPACRRGGRCGLQQPTPLSTGSDSLSEPVMDKEEAGAAGDLDPTRCCRHDGVDSATLQGRCHCAPVLQIWTSVGDVASAGPAPTLCSFVNST